MASITSFIRNTPTASLRAYFNTSGIVLPPALDWDASEPDVVRPLLQAVDDMDDEARGRVVNDADRVGSMSDDAGQVGPHEVGIAVRQIQDEEVGLLFDTPDHNQRFAKIGLRMARRMRQRHEHLTGASFTLPNVVLDDRIAAGELVFRLEPLVDPLRRVALFLRQHGWQRAVD